MRQHLRRLTGSPALRAVAKLSTGQFVAAAIPLLAAPILGRLYHPADYGALATYMAVSQMLATFSTLQFQQAILAERSEVRAEHLVYVCLWASVLVSSVAAVFGAGASLWMAGHPGYHDARFWMLALPLTTLAGGWIATVSALANRRGAFGAMARLPATQVAATTSSSMLFGFMGWGVHGLFASYLLGQAVSCALYFGLFRRQRSNNRRPNRPQLWAMTRRHRRYTFYTLPSEVIGSFNQQIPVFALGALGAVPLLGAFARARQLVAAPLTLLGSAIAQVFRQRAAEQYRQTGTCRPLYLRTFFTLLLIGVAPTLVLAFFAPALFAWFLGPSWREAGEVARILAPMLLLRLICSPLSSVFYFTQAQRLEFGLSIGSVLVMAGLMALPVAAGGSPTQLIVAYSAGFSLIYLVYLSIGWGLSRR